MMHRIQKVGVGQLAKMLGILYFLMGFVFVALFAVFSRAWPGPGGAGMPGFGFATGFGAVIIMPLLYGVFGVVSGALSALLYNFVAGFLGGVEIDLEAIGERPPT